MPGIFLNYRRDDAAGAAGRLHDYLARRFPRRDLLMDVDAIEPGFDFVKQLETSGIAMRRAACVDRAALVSGRGRAGSTPSGG